MFGLISVNLLVPKIKIESAVLSQNLGSAGWFSLYKIKEVLKSCRMGVVLRPYRKHISVSVLLTHPS